jgi:putative acetyltransferase
MKFKTRRAQSSDADDIAAAHLDSIRSIGPPFYSPDVVNDWAAGLTADLYVNAMRRGEVFFIAEAEIGGECVVLGFSSHRVDDVQHGTSVYVRGAATRQGIGTALFRLAEADAIASGADSLHVNASLAAVEFYKANGFEEIGRGEHRLRSGRAMACVFMRKVLATGSSSRRHAGGA